MTRVLSTAALQAINASETDEIFHMLITIEVPDAPPIFLTSNTETVTSRGRDYISYPFALELPSDEQGQISQARMSIDNVSRALIDEIRGLTNPLRLTIEVVLATSPDVVEYVANDYVLRDVTYDELSITGTLTSEDFLNEPYPKDLISAALFPGVF